METPTYAHVWLCYKCIFIYCYIVHTASLYWWVFARKINTCQVGTLALYRRGQTVTTSGEKIIILIMMPRHPHFIYHTTSPLHISPCRQIQYAPHTFPQIWLIPCTTISFSITQLWYFLHYSSLPFITLGGKFSNLFMPIRLWKSCWNIWSSNLANGFSLWILHIPISSIWCVHKCFLLARLIFLMGDVCNLQL